MALLTLIKILVDTGATGHYLTEAFKDYLYDVTEDTTMTIRLPDGSSITSSHCGYFHLPPLPKCARLAYVFPKLVHALYSVGQFCNVGCKATFYDEGFMLTYNNVTILTGSQQNNLWTADAPALPASLTRTALTGQLVEPTTVSSASTTLNAERPPTSTSITEVVTLDGNDEIYDQQFHANLIYPIANNAQRMLFYQRILCFPAKETLYIALTKFNPFDTWPGLRRALLKHYQLTEETAFGRLDLTRRNYKSTQVPYAHTEPDRRSFPNSSKRPLCYTATRRIFTDMSGIIDGEWYILVMFFEDKNYIHFEYMRSNDGPAYREAYLRGLDWYQETQAGRDSTPHFEILDNALDAITAAALTKRGISYQLVPPNNKRRNSAERANRTAENQVICCFAGADKSFDTKLNGHLLLPQAEITLNLLRESNTEPGVSAYVALRGIFDFNATPMAPPGCPVVVYNKQRPKLAAHGVRGYYIGPALKHYRCYETYVPTTRRTRVTDTIAWLPYTHELTPNALPGSFLPELAPPSDADVLPAPAIGGAPGQPPGLPAPLPLIPDNNIELEPQAVQPQEDAQPANPDEYDDLVPQLAPNIPPTHPAQDIAPQIDLQGTGGAPIPPTTGTDAGAPDPLLHADTARFFSGNYAGTAKDASDIPPQRRRRPTKQQRRRNAHERTRTQADIDNEAWDRAADQLPNPNSHLRPTLLAIGAAFAATAAQQYWLPRPRHATNVDDQHFNAAWWANATTGAGDATPTLPLPARASFARLRKGEDGAEWDAAFVDEIRRLVHRTNSIKWKSDGVVPTGRHATYANAVGYKKRVNNEDVYRIRLAYGGDNSDYDGERTSTMAEITAVKIAFNSVVSNRDLDYCTLDLRDMYLQSSLPPDRLEYMYMPLAIIPTALRMELGMHSLPEHTRILWEVHKALYGMPQAGRLAQQDLIRILKTGGYHMSPTTPCLFTHDTRKIKFLVWVDDFFVTYKRGDKTDVEHLMSVLSQMYEFKIDWTGSSYLGLTLHHDRIRHTFTVSLPGYILRMLAELGVTKGKHDPGSPIIYIAPTYGVKGGPGQLEDIDNSPPLGPADIKFLQRVVGKLLFFTRMIDPTIEVAVNRLGSVQAKATTRVLKDMDRLLQYVAHHPEPCLVYRPSTMQLLIHSDGSHLSESKSRSRAAGIFYLGDPPFNGPADRGRLHLMNAPIATVCSILPTVTQAASETEYATAYVNAQVGEAIRQTLMDFGFPQHPTPIIYDNIVAGKMANQSCKLRRSKAIAMRYHWLRDRVQMGHFIMVWRPGAINLADFLSKAHPVSHFRAMRPFFVHDNASTQV